MISYSEEKSETPKAVALARGACKERHGFGGVLPGLRDRHRPRALGVLSSNGGGPYDAPRLTFRPKQPAY